MAPSYSNTHIYPNADGDEKTYTNADEHMDRNADSNTDGHIDNDPNQYANAYSNDNT